MDKRRVRLLVAMPFITGAVVIGSATSASAAPARDGGCPGPFFEVTANQFLALPRTVAAMADLGLTREDILAQFPERFGNTFCVQVSHGSDVSSRPFGQYIYNVVDDRARR